MEAPIGIIVQIVAWSLAMMVISNYMGKKFSFSPSQQMDMQNKMQDFQDRLQLAYNSPEQMQLIQAEMQDFMKLMMKKQFIPSFIRMGIFFGFVALLGALYNDYDEILPFSVLIFGRGWFSLYLLISLSGTLVMAIYKQIHKKLHPNAPQYQEKFQDSLHLLQPNLILTQNQTGAVRSPQSSNRLPPPQDTDTWKQKSEK
jgi:hypothetical protein